MGEGSRKKKIKNMSSKKNIQLNLPFRPNSLKCKRTQQFLGKVKAMPPLQPTQKPPKVQHSPLSSPTTHLNSKHTRQHSLGMQDNNRIFLSSPSRPSLCPRST